MRYYAGIGSRDVPQHVMTYMTNIAFSLKQKDFILRSGGAIGSDSAFMAGALDRSEIFRPNDFLSNGRYVYPKWVEDEIVKHCWECPIDKMKPYISSLLKRNMMQILGPNGKTPVDFVICWTPTVDPLDKDAGGTRYATRCAEAYKIPIINLNIEEHCMIINKIIMK